MLKFNRGKTSMTLVSAKRDQIIQAIHASQARLKSSTPQEVAERIIRPNDVPGTVLNIALLNLSSGDSGLRTVAYNLLYQLSMMFNFAIGHELVHVKGFTMSGVIEIYHMLKFLGRTVYSVQQPHICASDQRKACHD
jgi:neurofibromin 1